MRVINALIALSLMLAGCGGGGGGSDNPIEAPKADLSVTLNDQGLSHIVIGDGDTVLFRAGISNTGNADANGAVVSVFVEEMNNAQQVTSSTVLLSDTATIKAGEEVTSPQYEVRIGGVPYFNIKASASYGGVTKTATIQGAVLLQNN